ncbi:MAG: tRNA (adenosine(37)-N6)-threonylcarbamoyltransferase complex ATPase subunit type 1 TsaE [Tissierellia bacterium]|nr:tRNA (adenosine(37)-N6)-threonylcarbamoyltransferase complex ATPase subunit type 1 TsaE [Tissierellia bacterium]
MRLENVAASRRLGHQLGQLLKPGDVLAFIGDLGVGKTTLIQALGQALGVKEEMTSPTFTLIHEYQARDLPVYHFDCYRMESPLEFLDIGGEDYLYGSGVCLIEWADMIEEFLPQDYLRLELSRQEDLSRDLKLGASGSRSKEIKEALEDLEDTGF